MLKLRRRHAPATATATRMDTLEIRNLLDDPRLRAVMGDVTDGAPAAPIDLDWSRTDSAHRSHFGRRLLQRAA